MKYIRSALSIAVALTIAAHAQEQERTLTTEATIAIPTEPGIYAHFDTTKGDIICRLEYEKTPMSVANFVGLCEGTIKNSVKAAGEPFYDGLTFHRVIPNFMIQGGDPSGNGSGGPGYMFGEEIDPTLKHDRPGILSMANAGPGTNGSQFFITHKEAPWLDGKHTVFGSVIVGLDIVNAIEGGDKMSDVNIHRVGDAAQAFVATQEAFEALRKAAFERAQSAAAAAKKAKIDKIKADFPNAQTTESGLMYIITKPGDGARPARGATTSVHYVGRLLNGQVFDSSVARGEPIPFPVGTGRVIPGWDEGIMLMHKGEKRTLVIPPNLAYGARGAGGVIPPNAWLVFDVELVDIH
jgi:peptidyl-prolyl cis-trans isomerase A (cyclophilin A)